MKDTYKSASYRYVKHLSQASYLVNDNKVVLFETRYKEDVAIKRDTHPHIKTRVSELHAEPLRLSPPFYWM